MDARNFIDLVERMRAAQNTYFRTRSKANLDASKAAERQVDEAVRAARRAEKAPAQLALSAVAESDADRATLRAALDYWQGVAEDAQIERDAAEKRLAELAPLIGYEADAARTIPADWSREKCLAVYGLGIAGEAGEAAETIKKHLGHGAALDRAALAEELGDVLWYVVAIAATEGITLAEVMAANVEKRRARFPNGFSEEAARARADEGNRA